MSAPISEPCAGVEEDLVVVDAARGLVPAAVERVARVARAVVGGRGVADGRHARRSVLGRGEGDAQVVVRLPRAPDVRRHGGLLAVLMSKEVAPKRPRPPCPCRRARR